MTAAVGTGLFLSPGVHVDHAAAPPTAGGSRAGQLASKKPSSRSAAVDEARRLISDIRLPKGAKLRIEGVAGMPAGMRRAAAQPGTPYLVDISRYWVTGMSQSTAYAWLESHEPAGSSVTARGTWGGPGVMVEDDQLTWRASGVLALEWMQESVAPLRTGSVARFDAEIAYYPERPRAERIPPGVDRITITAPDTSRRADSTTLASPARIREIEAVIAAMGRSFVTAQPGGPCIGARAVSEHYRIDFYAGARPTLVAVVTGRPWTVGLDNVDMSVEGTTQPGLFDAGLKLGHLVAGITRTTWRAPFC